MAKNFTDTQTGGSGATSQVGEKPTDTQSIKKSPGRPANLVNTGDEDDKKKKKKSSSTTETPATPPQQAPDGTAPAPVVAADPPDGGLVYDKGRVGRWKKIPVSGTPYFEERAGMTETDIQRGIAAGTIRDMRANPNVAPAVDGDSQESAPSVPSYGQATAPGQQSVPGDQVKLEFPMVAPMETLEVQEEVSRGSSFGIPENEIDEEEDERYNAPFFIPENEVNEEGIVDPTIIEDEPKKEGEVLSYPNRSDQYIVKDNKWHERPSDSDEWKPITSRGRVLGLNDYHKMSVPLPENDYKPKKGGVDVDGVTVYGYPSHPGQAYIIKNGSWYTMKQGDKAWSIIDNEVGIGGLNRYHGTKIETPSQLLKKGASLKPFTALSDAPAPKLFIKNGKVGTWDSVKSAVTGEESVKFTEVKMTEGEIAKGKKSGEIGYEGDGRMNDQVVADGDVSKNIQLKINKDQQERTLAAIGDKATQIGDVLEDRGLGFNKTDVDLATDSKGAAVQQYGTHVDALFNVPDRPSDLIGGRMWDEKHGRSLPPTDEEVLNAKKSKQIILDDLQVQLNAQSTPAQRDIVKKTFKAVLAEADDKIKNAEQGKVKQQESFDARNSYMLSDRYKEDQRNSIYKKKAELQAKTYGLYDTEAAKQMPIDYAEIVKLNKEIADDKLNNFVNTDLKKWNAIGGLSDSQVAQLEMAQSRAKNSLTLGYFSDSAEQLAEVEDFMETAIEINNRLADAYNRGMDITDVLAENKKVLYSQNKDVVSEEVGTLFEATLAMREFLSPYIDSGKVTVDALSGRYDISPRVSAIERAYIESKMTQLLDVYDAAKANIFSKNKEIIEDKRKELNSILAAIARAEKELSSGDVVSSESIKKQLNSMRDQITELRGDIAELEGSENTMFLNDPRKLSLDLASKATTSSRQILNAIPEGVTPKQRLDIFYETLLAKNQYLAKKYKISQDFFDRAGEKARDILDWEYLGAKLSPQEIEYYKNAGILRQMLPIYLNNDWGVTEESAGFWSAFDNAFTSTFAPNTSAAYGFINETTMVSTQFEMGQEAGLTPEDFAAGMTYDKILDRMDVNFLSFETAGTMLGTTGAIMGGMIASGGTGAGLMKAGSGIYRLLDTYKDFDNITDAIRDFERVGKAYQNTMESTRLGRFVGKSVSEGLKYEMTGRRLNMDDNMNFASGVAGAMASKGFEKILSKMSPAALLEWVGKYFGTNTSRAVAVFEKLGAKTRVLRTASNKGFGEVPEELAQELVGIYRDELRERGFWDEVNSRYGGENLSNLGELIVSSFVLGMGMGLASSSSQQDMLSAVDAKELEKILELQQELHKGFSAADANANVAANRIVDNKEAVYGSAEKQSSIEPEAAEETADAEPKKTPFGVLIYQDGKVGMWKKIPGSGTPFFEEKRGMTETDIKLGIESGAIQDMDAKSVDKKEEVTDKEVSEVTDTPSESVGETANEGEGDAKVISLADRVRSLKFTNDGVEDTTTAETEAEATALWEKGYVPVVDGKPRYDLTSEEVAELAKSGEALEMILPKAMAAGSGVPKSVWNAAVGGVAATVDTIAKIIENIQASEWYKKLRSKNPERADKVDAQLSAIEKGIIDTGIEYKAPKNPTADMQLIKKKIATFKQGRATGVEDGRKLTKQELSKNKADIEAIQEEIIAYANEHLPAKLYSTTDVTNLMRRAVRATTMSEVGKAIEAIDKQVSKFEEQVRLKSVDRVISKLNDPLTKKPGSRRVGRIDLDSRESLAALADELRGVKPVKSDNNAEETERLEIAGLQMLIEEIEARYEGLDFFDSVMIIDYHLSGQEVNSIDDLQPRWEDVDSVREKKLELLEILSKYEDGGASLLSDINSDYYKALKMDRDVKYDKWKSANPSEGEESSTDGDVKSVEEVIKAMSQEELDGFEEKVDDIISEGKRIIKSNEEDKRATRNFEREIPFRILSEQNKSKQILKSGEKEIGDFFTSKQGVVMHDGSVFRSKRAFDEHLKKNGLSYDTLGDVQVVLSSDIKEAQKRYESKSTSLRVSRKASDAVQSTNRTIESRLMDVYRGSKELRGWVKGNILDPINKAYIDRNDARKAKLDSFKKDMNAIFGHSLVTGLPKSLNKDTGLTIKGNSVAINNNQAVNIATMSTVDPSMIYKVGENYYKSESEAIAAAKNKIKSETGKESVTDEEAKQEMNEVTDKYNVNLLMQISEDQDLESGLAKIAEIESYVDGNPEMKAFSDLIKSKYKEYRADYESTFEDLYDLKFKDGDYVPMTRSVDSEVDSNNPALLGKDFKGGATTATSNHLKQKYNQSQTAYDLTTGAYEKLLEYVSSMEHAKHFIPVAESSKNLINAAVKPQLVEKLGKNRVTELEYHLNDIITDGASADRSEGGKGINMWLKFNVITTLAFKIASIPKQLTSATHYLGAGLDDGVGTMKVLEQALKLAPTSLGVSKFVLSKEDVAVIRAVLDSSFVRERMSGKDIDYETRKLFNDIGNSKGKNLQNNLVKMMMFPTVLGDIGGVLVGGIPFTLATYKNNVKNKGMLPEAAMKDAVDKFISVSNQTQQSVRRDIISNAQKDPTYRLFLTYKTSQIAAMAQMVKGMKIVTGAPGEYTFNERVNAIRKIVYYGLANSVFQIVAGGTFAMYYGDDNDDDERAKERKDTALYNLIMDTLSSNAQGFGLPGVIADWTMNVLRNREIFNNIPVVQMMMNFAKGTGEATKILGDGGDLTKDSSDQDVAIWSKIAGIKNIISQAETWKQYMGGESDLTWVDAIMDRKEDEEGHKFKTGIERDDWLYQWLFDEIKPEPAPFNKDVRERMTTSPIDESPEFKSAGDIMVERSNSGVFTQEYTTDEFQGKRERRDAEGIRQRKKSEKYNRRPRSEKWNRK